MIDRQASRTFTVAVVGFGAMGKPIARRLKSHGNAVLAIDPSPEARTHATCAGIPAFDDIATAPPCDVVLVLVATGQQLLDTVKSATSARRRMDDETWVISSTVGPQAARDATALLAEARATIIDAPVTGGVPGAENGTLRFLAAGSLATLDAAAPLFSVLGMATLVGERPGDGQATKVVNQLCSSVHLAAAAEAVALATRLGLDPVKTVDVISGGSGSSWFFDERGPRMARLDTDPEVLTRLAILAKDNSLVETEADASDAHVPLLKAAKQQYLRAAELDLLEADDSQIIRTYLD